jgi:hypothetical protein
MPLSLSNGHIGVTKACYFFVSSQHFFFRAISSRWISCFHSYVVSSHLSAVYFYRCISRYVCIVTNIFPTWPLTVIISYCGYCGAGIATCCGMDGSVLETQCVQEICCSPLPLRPILEPTQPLVRWVPGRFWGNKEACRWLWPPTPM